MLDAVIYKARMRRYASPCRYAIVALSACLAIVLAVPEPAAAANRSKRTPGVLVLFAQARRFVRKNRQLSRAIPLEADGTSSKGEATTAADINRWRFVFDNQSTPKSSFRSAFITYRSHRFGRPTGVRDEFLGDRRLRVLPRMILRTAIAKLRAAGYQDPFFAVNLRFPLDPAFTEPLYIFGFNGGPRPPRLFVGVGTRTGSVAPIQ
jgi:hypothetical protein